jgi:hypothetical protein
MKTLSRLLMLAALAAAFSLPAFAQDPAASPAAAGPCEEAAKGELYKQYYDVRKTDQPKAYEFGKQYLAKYESCPDNYTTSVKKFVTAYEKATLRVDFFKAYDAKDVAKLNSLSKQLLANDPNDVAVAMLTAWGSYQNIAKNPGTEADIVASTTKAIQMIEAGGEPKNLEDKVSWLAFANKEDALGYLNYALGQLMNAQKNYAESVKYLVKVAQSQSKAREDAGVYSLLAFGYEKEREPMAEQYKTVTKNFTVETPESQLLLLNINQVVDRQIDAYARAVAFSTDPAKKADLMKVLTELYKSRHNNADAGLNELIAGIKAQPLLMTQPITALPAPTPAGGTGGEGAASAPTTPVATPVANPSAPAAKPAVTTTATTQTKPATTSAAPAKKKP